ncbi:MAG: YafY family transcriptional regulator [Clostridiales bacterium]|nr:YafY family transcriptional regulator [Clostridiales bacterium]
MKYELLLQILFTLLGKEKVSARELAEKYEISTRTVYRYVETIEGAFVPIERTSGRNGGFAIPDYFRLPATYLSDKELSALLSAVATLGAELSSTDLNSAREKLIATRKRRFATLPTPAPYVIIDSGSWGDADSSKGKIALLNQAAEQNGKVEVRYHNNDGVFTTRVLRPYYLILKQGVWYVYAYCELREEFRLFRVGRMAEITLTGRTFLREEIAPPTLDFTAMLEDKITFTIKVEKESLSAAEDLFGVERMQVNENGTFFTCQMPNDDVLIRELMHLGSSVTVVQPQELKEKLKSAALALFERN